MMIYYNDNERLEKILGRGEVFEGQYLQTVLDILKDVKTNGDTAIRELNLKFDKYDINDGFEIPREDLKTAYDKLDNDLKKALEKAKSNIVKFHEMQMENTWMNHGKDGRILGQKITPLDKVGIYVPGGKAVYPSTVLMDCLPAKVAGVGEIIMTTPATNGFVNEIVLAAAYIAGVDRVFRVGGAQAIAALAYGTESVPKVDKIVGPGNIFVALAKKMVFGTVDIDMIAGPSEILVIADKTANPKYIAADMLSQAEHDELASSVVITDDELLAQKVEAEVLIQLEQLPKKEMAKKSLDDYGAIFVVKDLDEAAELSNKIAPEHLELVVTHPMELMLKIRHAGAIFMGEHTPEAVGDYIAGPNHTLPTGGTARFFSPLGTYDFIKRSSLIMYNKEALQSEAADIMKIAELEELIAHRNSVKVRVEE
jgi:histidinol dehydrogenase